LALDALFWRVSGTIVGTGRSVANERYGRDDIGDDRRPFTLARAHGLGTAAVPEGRMPYFTFDISTALGLGQDAAALTFTQISLRGIIVFIATLVIVRCGDRRFLSQKTAFDAVLGFILASMLARAVNGTAAFVPTLGAGFVLVALHRVLAYWSRRSHAFGLLIKGRSDVIVRDGHVDDPVAKRNRLSEHDLLEDLRLNGNVRDIRDVALAVFERNGQISVIRRELS
jgi:YetF C-terminal domain